MLGKDVNVRKLVSCLNRTPYGNNCISLVGNQNKLVFDFVEVEFRILQKENLKNNHLSGLTHINNLTWDWYLNKNNILFLCSYPNTFVI